MQRFFNSIKPELNTQWEILLPKDILQNTLFGYLELNEASTLANASVLFAETCKKQLERESLVTRLLAYIAQGEQNEAEGMLKEDPSLLLRKGNVTDLSGRKFYQITALQYALWALDRHMWEMLFEHFIDKNKAAEQLQELEAFGIEYLMLKACESKADMKREKHFDFSSIIDVLQTHCNSYYLRDTTFDQSHDSWCKVGVQQRNLPAHVVNEYCHPSRELYPVPDFKEKVLPRQRTFNKQQRDSSWYTDKDLGVNFAITCEPPLRGAQGKPYNLVPYGEKDLFALKALYKVRTEELELFKMQLKSTEEAAPGFKQG